MNILVLFCSYAYVRSPHRSRRREMERRNTIPTAAFVEVLAAEKELLPLLETVRSSIRGINYLKERDHYVQLNRIATVEKAFVIESHDTAHYRSCDDGLGLFHDFEEAVYVLRGKIFGHHLSDTVSDHGVYYIPENRRDFG